MICVGVNAQQVLQVLNQTADECQGYILVSKAEYDFWFDYVSVSPADAATSITFGLGVVLGLGYLSTYPLKVALDVIRKI